MWALRAVGGGAGGRGVAPRLRRAGRRARQKGAAPSGSCLVGGYYLMLLKCRHSRSIFSYSWHLEDTLRVDRSLSYLPSLYLTFPLRPAPETARTGAPAQRPPTRSDALAGRNPVGMKLANPCLMPHSVKCRADESQLLELAVILFHDSRRLCHPARR